VKNHFAHRDSDKSLHGRATMRFNRTSHVDVAEDDTAENCAG
jgi:hypothetical protein